MKVYVDSVQINRVETTALDGNDRSYAIVDADVHYTVVHRYNELSGVLTITPEDTVMLADLSEYVSAKVRKTFENINAERTM